MASCLCCLVIFGGDVPSSWHEVASTQALPEGPGYEARHEVSWYRSGILAKVLLKLLKRAWIDSAAHLRTPSLGDFCCGQLLATVIH